MVDRSRVVAVLVYVKIRMSSSLPKTPILESARPRPDFSIGISFIEFGGLHVELWPF